MKNLLKKSFALLLAMTVVLSTLTITSLAATSADASYEGNPGEVVEFTIQHEACRGIQCQNITYSNYGLFSSVVAEIPSGEQGIADYREIIVAPSGGDNQTVSVTYKVTIASTAAPGDSCDITFADLIYTDDNFDDAFDWADFTITVSVPAASCTIDVTSKLVDDSVDSFALLTGGNVYNSGDSVTVTAEDLSGSGLAFAGWYNGSYDPANKLSESLSYTFTAAGDLNLIAYYDDSQATGIRLLVNASAFNLVIGGTSLGAQTDTFLGYYPFGTPVTLTYTDATTPFRSWLNENGNMMSKSEGYSFKLVTDQELTAVTDSAEDASATVVFLDHHDRVISVLTATAASDITLPAGPSRIGYTFTGWDLTADQIKVQVSSSSYIEVKGQYEKAETGATLTVVTRFGTVDQADPAVYNVTVGDEVTMLPDEIEGHTFKGWCDASGNVISTQAKYHVWMLQDMTVYAVYDDAAITDDAFITMVDSSVAYEDGKYVYRFSAERSLPASATLIETGMIRVTTDQVASDAEAFAALTRDSAIASFYKSNTTEKNGTVVNILRTTSASRGIYVRGYCVYEGPAGIVTIYTDMIVGNSTGVTVYSSN